MTDAELELKVINAIRGKTNQRQRAVMLMVDMDPDSREQSNRVSKLLGQLRDRGIIRNAKRSSPMWSWVEPIETPGTPMKPKGMFFADICECAEEFPDPRIPLLPTPADFNRGLLTLFNGLTGFAIATNATRPEGDLITEEHFKRFVARHGAEFILDMIRFCRVFGADAEMMEEEIKCRLTPASATLLGEPQSWAAACAADEDAS